MLRMSYRNLLRNKRRTIITLSSIIFAAFLTSTTRYFTYGTHRDMVEHAIGLGTGYIQITAYGWLESGRRLERALDFTDELQNKLNRAGIKTFSPRIESGALASHGSESRFVIARTFDPAREMKITNIHKKVKSGTYLSEDSIVGYKRIDENREIPVYAAIIGYKLAEFLNLKVGDELTLVTSQFDGSVGAILTRIEGIIRADNTTIDSSTVLLNLEAGRVLFAPGSGSEFERYTSLALPADNPTESLDLARKLKELFPAPVTADAPEDSFNYDPVVMNWEELNQDLVQYLIMDQFGNEVIIVILLLVMAFGILTTVELSIHERNREFGILMAIGTRNNIILKMVLIEVSLLLGMGIVIGILMGAALSLYFQLNPIVLTGDYADMAVDYGSVVAIRPILDFTETYIAIAALAIPSLIFSYLGARRIRKLKPAEIIATL